MHLKECVMFSEILSISVISLIHYRLDIVQNVKYGAQEKYKKNGSFFNYWKAFQGYTGPMMGGECESPRRSSVHLLKCCRLGASPGN